MKISLVEALNIFRQDLSAFESQVSNSVTVPLSQHQFDALVSWHFNTGSIQVATLTKKLNAGDYVGAAKEFARWNKAGGKVLAGLVKRRKHETAIFKNADYGDPVINVFEKKGGKAKTVSITELKSLLHQTGEVEESQTTEELLANPNSKLLPRFRPRQSEAVSRATIDKFSDLVPADRQDDAVKILAIRGYYTNTLGRKGVNDRNLYDDAIFVVEPDGVHNFNGNTDPSRFRRGIAKLKAPQAVRYIPGPHGYKRKNGPYPAFRQNNECTVVRDQTGDDTGIFWINLHRGGNTTTSSAGCQTVPPHQWNEFKTLVDNLLDKYGQKTFYYVLINEADVVPETDVTIPETDIGIPHLPSDQAVGGRDPKAIGLALLLLVNIIRKSRGKEPLEIPESLMSDNGDADDPISQLIEDAVSEKTDNTTSKLTPVNSALGQTVGTMLDGKKTGLGIIGVLLALLMPDLNGELANALGMGNEGLLNEAVPDAPKKDDVEGVIETIMPTTNYWLPISVALASWGGLGKLEKWVFMLKDRK